MTRMLYFYPIVLTAIGICIHFFGALKLFQLEVPQIIHILMLVIDLLVVVGLIKRTIFGYWLAVLLYVEQPILQPYWAYAAFIHNGTLFQLFVTCPLVISSLAILIFNKQLFTKDVP